MIDNIPTLVIPSTLFIAFLGWLATALTNLTKSINELNSTTKVLSKTTDILNDGMLENRKHIGELFASDDSLRVEIGKIQTACSIHHRRD